MHIGPYATEPDTINSLMEFMELQHICQKKGVQKLSEGSERFFAYCRLGRPSPESS